MRCGVGDYASELAGALSRCAGFDVHVVTSELDGKHASDDGPELSPIMPSWGIGHLRRFVSLARRVQPDIVHLQFPTQGYKALTGVAMMPCLSRLILGVPVVQTWHEYVPRNLPKIACYMNAMAVCANAIVVVRPDYLEKTPWLTKILIGKTPVRLIPNVSAIPAVALSPEERKAIRDRWGCGSTKLIVYFGFASPHKGIDQIFRIADPQYHKLLLICDLSPQNAYHSELLALAESAGWKGKVTIAGFMEAIEAARLLAAADAAVFPFTDGGGTWNSSVHAALCQGIFVLTTSSTKNGYDADDNIYYARPGAIDEMKRALLQFQGSRRAADVDDQWMMVARAHADLYRALLSAKRNG